ncbi:MAG: bifunctional diguanylate cyclase/phosphodiesterase [Campylobacterota bacterium]
MKSFNYYYTSKAHLYNYLEKNHAKFQGSVLIQVFTGVCDKLSINQLLSHLTFFLPHAHIIGATSGGEIEGANVSDGQTLLCFSVFEDTILQTHEASGDFHTDTIAKNITKTVPSKNLQSLITFTTGRGVDSAGFLEHLSALDTTVSGGVAVGDEDFKNAYVFTHNRVIANGAVAVSLHSTSLHVNIASSFGWEAMGKPLSVTKTSGKVVHTIDDIPVKTLYQNYFGEDIVNLLPKTGIEFPLIVYRQGTPVARFVTDVKKGGFVFSGPVQEGEEVFFGFANVEKILECKDKLAKDIASKPAESIFVYSCVARRLLLGKMAQLEIEPLNSIATVSGFFTFSEFLKPKSKGAVLLNHTMTVVSMSESSRINKDFKPQNCAVKTQNDRTIKALSTFISKTSRQLNLLNQDLQKSVDEKTSQLRKSNKNLLKKVYFDELTGLGNRDLLLKKLQNKHNDYTLILLDVNNFKDINDLYGVKSGDQVLKDLTSILTDMTRQEGLECYRVSGDEFAIISKKHAEAAPSISLIKRLDESIKGHMFSINVQNHMVDIYISVAMGLAHKTGALIEHSNLALAQAKKEGVVYRQYLDSLNLEKNIQNNIYWNNSLRVAISQDRIVPYFQPIFTNGGPTKYEALMRMIDEEGKPISPFFFLDIAKKSGDYGKLTRIMIEKTCKIFAGRSEEFSINLSYEDMVDEEMCAFIEERADRYGVSERMILEIVESEYIKNFEKVNTFLSKMRQKGTRIAIDDFGSGYANFSYLLEIKPNYIKIDGSIMKNIDHDPDSLMIAETITMFSKKLGAKTVGEFIHSQAVLEKAIDLGVDSFQGFLLGKPKPLEGL